MGCGRNNVEGTSHREGCVCEVVKTILKLQNHVVRHDCDECGTSCFLEPLGGLVNHTRNQADTRVFMLLNKDGTPFKAFFKEKDDNNGKGKGKGKGNDGKGDGKKDKDNELHFSPFFRVEDVFGDCCATLRVVAPVDENGDVVDVFDENGNFDLMEFDDVEDYEKTDSCLTVDLEAFVAIQCIADVDLNICKK
ncbi:spore coat protein Z [Ureibacillus xyleni]|uniref:Spore coat protein Z n=1 Tax=Ureibacillus xyleni TaxID=614648 RepID=A0A285RCY4_9BACL|nr:CotY/CotZ family spore coat protein [Ureibacillus xyleni]SOB91754.1 spore coat protein Z [Ureibacillus xyleni]